MARNATAKLLAAQERRRVVVCDLPPFEDRRVKYEPRNKHDSTPWALIGVDWYRLSAAECRAVDAGTLDK